jgi:hypothetical protein
MVTINSHIRIILGDQPHQNQNVGAPAHSSHNAML